jgi:hypothetical protein
VHREHLTLEPLGFKSASFKKNLLEQFLHSMTISRVSWDRYWTGALNQLLLTKISTRLFKRRPSSLPSEETKSLAPSTAVAIR